MNVPESLKPLGMVVAVLVVALLIIGELGVPYRGKHPSDGYDQSRTHWNTKNTTRFGGAGSREIEVRISRSVYLATDPATG